LGLGRFAREVIWLKDGCPRNVRAPTVSRLVHSSFTTPRKNRPSRTSRGFTLLEVLLTIAIISLLGGVLIAGAANLLREQPTSSHEVFWLSVREARKTALKSEHEIRLKFDRDKKTFILIDGIAPTTLSADGFTREETPLKQFPIVSALGSDLTVDFLAPPTKGGNMILVGGVLLESQTIPFVTFYSDGTCTPFRAQFARSGASSMLSIDPWTCAPVLTPADANALAP
jgi:general secretion pathway protein H